jgi:hypothetical protein
LKIFNEWLEETSSVVIIVVFVVLLAFLLGTHVLLPPPSLSRLFAFFFTFVGICEISGRVDGGRLLLGEVGEGRGLCGELVGEVGELRGVLEVLCYFE